MRNNIGFIAHSWIEEIIVSGANIEVKLTKYFSHTKYLAETITTSPDGIRGKFTISVIPKIKKKKQRVHFYNPEKYLS